MDSKKKTLFTGTLYFLLCKLNPKFYLALCILQVLEPLVTASDDKSEKTDSIDPVMKEYMERVQQQRSAPQKAPASVVS